MSLGSLGVSYERVLFKPPSKSTRQRLDYCRCRHSHVCRRVQRRQLVSLFSYFHRDSQL
jgi:hypothetical protein